VNKKNRLKYYFFKKNAISSIYFLRHDNWPQEYIYIKIKKRIVEYKLYISKLIFFSCFLYFYKEKLLLDRLWDY